MNEFIEKIHSTGYWDVKIRPSQYESERVKDLGECKKIIDESAVLLRGWDYPHFDLPKIEHGIDFIGSGVDFLSHIEYWRFHQTGQFIHHFACMEEYEIDVEKIPFMSARNPSPSGKYLSILNTLYTLTEIFLFASRLASKAILDPECNIAITFHGMKDRQLIFLDHGRYLRRAYISSLDEIPFSGTYTIPELTSDYARLARVAMKWIFDRFQWTDITESHFTEEQTNFLERNW